MKKNLLMMSCLLFFLQAQVYVYGEDLAEQETGKADKATSYHGLTMYVMKNGEAILTMPASEMHLIEFSNSAKGAMIVQKNDGSLDDNCDLSDVWFFIFEEERFLLLTPKGYEFHKIYDYDDIRKITFDATYTGINNPVAESGSDVIVHITPTGDVTVESAVAIKSLTLFSIDGRLISKEHYAGAEMRKTASLRKANAGVYLVRVETEQGTVVKKIVKSLNR